MARSVWTVECSLHIHVWALHTPHSELTWHRLAWSESGVWTIFIPVTLPLTPGPGPGQSEAWDAETGQWEAGSVCHYWGSWVSGYRQTPVASISAISLPSPNIAIWTSEQSDHDSLLGRKWILFLCAFMFKITVESRSISRVQIPRRDPQRSLKLCWAKN